MKIITTTIQSHGGRNDALAERGQGMTRIIAALAIVLGVAAVACSSSAVEPTPTRGPSSVLQRPAWLDETPTPTPRFYATCKDANADGYRNLIRLIGNNNPRVWLHMKTNTIIQLGHAGGDRDGDGIACEPYNPR